MEDLTTYALMRILCHPVLHSSDKVTLSQVCFRWYSLLCKRLPHHNQMATVKEKSIWYQITPPFEDFEEIITNNDLTPIEILSSCVGNKHIDKLRRLDIINVKLYLYHLYRAKSHVISFQITYCNGKEDVPFKRYFVAYDILRQFVSDPPSKKAAIYHCGAIVPITTPSEVKINEDILMANGLLVSIFYCYQYVMGKWTK